MIQLVYHLFLFRILVLLNHLHHAAAALGIPSVVIWTGFSSPRHLGYDTHRNIHDGSEPCGTYSGVCKHCLLKAKQITVEQVLDAVNTEWYRPQR